jgi:hypothetical protein
VTEVDQRARRLVIAYAILLHALERSYPELKPEYSFAPMWWRITAYVIAGCTVAFFSFSFFGVFLMLFGN